MSMIGEKNRRNLQDRLAREWRVKNRDPFLYWGSWVVGSLALACITATVIYRVYH